MTTQATNIFTGGIGLVYMRIDKDGKTYRFPCSAFEYTMAQNRIPAIMAYVGTGRFMASSEEYVSPEIVMEWLTDPARQTELVNGLVPCSFYEEATEGGFPSDKRIFKGYVAYGAPVYTAGAGGSATQLMFQCFGMAAPLMTSPGSAYIESYLGVEIERKREQVQVDLAKAVSKGGGYMLKKETPDQILALGGSELKKAPIVKRVGVCVALARLASSWLPLKDFKENFKMDERVQEAFGGYTMLETAELDPRCDDEYTKQMLTAFLANISSGTLYDTIIGILTSNSFVLEANPRWNCDDKEDFKMDIVPSTIWNPRRTITLGASKLVSFRMQHDALRNLNTPDTILLNFNDIDKYLSDANRSFTLGIIGVATKSSALDVKMRAHAADNDTEGMADDMRTCKALEVPAPAWLGIAVTRPKYRTKAKRNPDKGMVVERTPGTTSEELSTKDTSDDQPDLKRPDSYGDGDAVTSMYDVANRMARAVFLHHYLTMATASVDVLPNMRFGLDKVNNADGVCFEDSIGDTIIVDLPSGTGKGIRMKSVLNGVVYKYTSGQSSSVSYTLLLERVRPADIKEPNMPCPIYKIGNKQ